MGPLSGFVAGSSSWSSRPPAFARQVARSHGISFGSVLLCPPFRGPGGPLRGYGLVRSRRPDQLLASCPRSRGLRGCGLLRSRCPDQLLASCPRSRGLRGCGLLRSRCPDQLLASCPRSRGLRGCSLVRSRRPDRLLASCPGSRGLRGYDLVRSRRLEHGVEHAEQLPGHRHDGPLLLTGASRGDLRSAERRGLETLTERRRRGAKTAQRLLFDTAGPSSTGESGTCTSWFGRWSPDPAVRPTGGLQVTRQRSGTGRPAVAEDGRVRGPVPEPAQSIREERKHATTATLQHGRLELPGTATFLVEALASSPWVAVLPDTLPGADSKRCQKEEVGEIEPVRHHPRPWMPEPDLEGGAREHLGTDEDDQPDEQTSGQDTRLPLVGHDPVGFRCHFPCTPFSLPRPDRRRSMSSQGLYQHP